MDFPIIGAGVFEDNTINSRIIKEPSLTIDRSKF